MSHHLLEGHSLFDHRSATAAVEERLLNARETAAEDADDEIVLVVGLRFGRTAPIELLQQGDQTI
jgi:hypothetical protein